MVLSNYETIKGFEGGTSEYVTRSNTVNVIYLFLEEFGPMASEMLPLDKAEKLVAKGRQRPAARIVGIEEYILVPFDIYEALSQVTVI